MVKLIVKKDFQGLLLLVKRSSIQQGAEKDLSNINQLRSTEQMQHRYQRLDEKKVEYHVLCMQIKEIPSINQDGIEYQYRCKLMS